MAGLTVKLEFATGILVLPQRQTALVAKQAATLDRLCGGRLRLGIGVGWNETEYIALGENFHSRGRRCEEQIQVLRQFWTEPRGSEGTQMSSCVGRRGSAMGGCPHLIARRQQRPPWTSLKSICRPRVALSRPLVSRHASALQTGTWIHLRGRWRPGRRPVPATYR
jgi:alkanesulfonate monooxygenase SsuD/methylene tetrahydromethanopterin reductase-like flavin-dependent oxidoreductase (luciferase family)